MNETARAAEVQAATDDGYQAAVPEGWRRQERWSPEQKRLARRRRLNRRIFGRGVAHIKQITWIWLLGFLTYGAVTYAPRAWEWATYEQPQSVKPEPIPLVRLHVSYNSSTGNQSKWVERVGFEAKSYLQGMGRLRYETGPDGPEGVYRCRVSPEYWQMVSENSFHDIPVGKCQRFDP